MADLRNYVAAGYFLSRHAGAHDCTGRELRRITMAHDHSQRRFFPESWTVSWCSETREQRIEEAASFGIAEGGLDEVMAWADKSFGSLPPPQQPGYAPVGASGLHIATCVRPSPLAENGTAPGHEILIADIGCSFNSPESLHLDDRERLGEVSVVTNEHGLIDSFDDALACCRVIEPAPAEGRSPGTTWMPWLIVRYAL